MRNREREKERERKKVRERELVIADSVAMMYSNSTSYNRHAGSNARKILTAVELKRNEYNHFEDCHLTMPKPRPESDQNCFIVFQIAWPR